MIGDYYDYKWRRTKPWYPYTIPIWPETEISKQEFDDLKHEIEELKELLRRAKQYDIDNNEPDCEIDEKMDKLKRVAEIVGIDLDEVLQNGTA